MQAHSEIEHEMTLFAEPIAHVGDFPITNSLLSSVITVIILVAFFIIAGKRIARVPKGLQNLFEIILENTLNFADSVTGSRKKSERFMPIVLGLFLFILVNNYLGILPGFGTIGFVENHEGHNVFVPFLRGGSADLNTTLALAVVAMLATHIFGITSIGIWKHLNKFVNFKAIYEIPSKFKEDKAVLFVNPIKVFVCLIEIVSEIAKIVSLSFRLFGNIFAGEVLIATMMTLSAFLLPIPFLFLEVLVCAVQALV
ncbi:MAG: FoF1 ATP synthase subunit a, partial [Patescibacteria group bacterium]|nr:FoF1 ATP synthase subunit a [Patescibacteria group bacterium]